MKKFDISKGNRKMVKGFLIWNLPAVSTCPGSTAICRKECYALKAERAYKAVLPSRERNLEFSKTDNFIKDMIFAIDKASKSKSFRGFFRIHESGDFYSQGYLEAWKAIARVFPDIHFLAFTKSFHLDFSGLTENFQIVMSVMPDTKLNVPENFPKAYAGNCANMNNTIPCPGNCDNCGMCWALNQIGKNVHFDMH